ncbi:hypothetical protein UFOVP498_1 [uncultured Caudovirales phage]|uniref:Uncharacterized protein n=1 Tax=uncultured Caudovirales phage TaxID=2100421 RepID=A0A6J5MI46_9CAUD|nr:hypothetical protein UFOVP498_1 [uncultured Caudovirales phage]
MKKNGVVPTASEIASFPPEIRQQFLRRIRDSDPDYVRNRRKDFERQRLESETSPQASAGPALAPNPRGIVELGGGVSKGAAIDSFQRGREGRNRVVAGPDRIKQP